ncbi:hypothetical protein [Terricaulis sp.]|uniref:hypothetical protein n=1 Tax=Terricaulis sp. TaxID=2768686 RepID=UPI002AC41C13|nr:hypothetical protein [Terricaulis sp.]MDZ4691511.1 hypothetical protein [Terricaulis sp.]
MARRHKDTDIFAGPKPKKRDLWKGGIHIPGLGWFPRMSMQKSLYGVLLAAAAADGDVHNLELGEIHVLAERIKTLSSTPRMKLGKMQAQFKPHLQPKKLLEFTDLATRRLRSASEDRRASAFMHALDILFADRVLTDTERDFVKHLVHKLRIKDKTAEQCVDVMLTKNRH